MSNSTSTAITETTTLFSYLDFYLSLIQIPSFTTQVFLWGYLVTFLLGFTGNTLSFLTFYRPALRKVSTGCLFILLAISDTLYLLVAVVDFVEFGLQIRLYHRIDYEALCRFRVFTICVAQLYSAWLLVIIATDRWIRTRFPFKANSLCTLKKALFSAAILLIVVIGLNSHMLLPFFGMVLPGIPHLACAPNGVNAQYSTFYFLQWTIIQIVTTSLGPAFLMIIMAIDMSIKIRGQKKAIFYQPQPVIVDQSAGRAKRVHNQMILLMLSSIGIFLITTFPLTIDHIVASYTLNISDLSNFFNTTTILNWFQSLNCAVNFYVYCLTSTLFRKEFIELVGKIRGQREPTVTIGKQTRVSHQIQQQRH